MKLNLGMIMDYLETPYEHVVGCPGGAMNLIGICPFIAERPYAEDILYLAQWPQLRELHRLPENVICLGGGGNAVTLLDKHQVRGLIYSADSNQSAIMLEIQNSFFKYADHERALLDALLTNKSLQTVLNACAAFLDCHVSLYGSDMALLGYSDINLPPDSNTIWQETLAANHWVLPMNPGETAKERQIKSKPSPRSTFLSSGDASRDYISISFEYKSSRVATLIFSRTYGALSGHHLWLTDCIAEILHKTVIERFNTFVDVHDYFRASITTALRYSTVMESKFLHTNMARLGWRTNDDYQILLVKLPPEDKNISHFLYDYENVFAGSYSDCVAFWFDDFIFVLLHNDACSLLEKNIPLLKKQLKLNNGSCSIGMKFCDFNILKLQYNLAMLPHRVSSLSKCRIKYYRDVLGMHIINDLSSCFPLRAVCHHAAFRLQEYDIANKTNFLETLEAYLLSNRSLLTASSKLFIHRSTLAYRIKCIENITPMQLEDPFERLHILLSCMILRLINNNALSDVDYPGATPRIAPGSHPDTYTDQNEETAQRKGFSS
ncbi:MAG: hypothetical protein GXY05_02030 [Clostridiales bacterium]|nr:hypothetical protein [Clostridiales bacterium]